MSGLLGYLLIGLGVAFFYVGSVGIAYNYGRVQAIKRITTGLTELQRQEYWQRFHIQNGVEGDNK